MMHPQHALTEEAQRFFNLRDLDLLDSPDGETFDRLTRMACRMFNTAFAAVSLIDQDRHRFRSVAGVHLRGLAGVPLRQIPLGGTPCAVVAAQQDALVVPDMRLDDRFLDGPLVAAGLWFYAGVPLVTRAGRTLGAFCVMDDQARHLSPEDLEALADMARLVMDQIDLHSDPLTRLPSRHQLVHDLEDLERTRPGAPIVPVLIDIAAPIDFSCAISILGTACIDDVVLSTSRLIRDTLGRLIPLYKLDATSYLALVDEAAGTSWQDVVTELATGLAVPVLSSGVPMLIKAVFGIAPFRFGSAPPDDIIRNAIGAAQEARDQGQQIGVYSVAGDTAMRRRFRLLVDLRAALLADDQLFLVFQPRMDIASGRCIGVEALLRWKHPEFGLVPPGEFIPLVEQTALARPVTEWVIEAALRQLVIWADAGRSLRMSVNVSGHNLEEADFGNRLAAALGAHAVDPANLELELTETALVGSGLRVQAQLDEVRALGVIIAIDDFGTGYSTFSYLMRIPASVVKLDQSFIARLSLSSRDQTLVRSMIAMAHDLGFRVVAEGVETPETLKILGDGGCDEAQGYLICRPLPADKLDAWLLAREQPLATLPQDSLPQEAGAAARQTVPASG